MKTFQSIIPAFGLIAAAQALTSGWNGTYVTTTITTDIYTTYCPVATTFPYGTKTYTATASEYITITDCPCTYVTSHEAYPTSYPTSYPHSYVQPSGNVTQSWCPPVYVTSTEIVETLTTYCPVPTTVVQGTKTYTVTEPTTLIITECPCTKTTTVPETATQYITSTFEILTTYCPSPTAITYSSQTYEVTTTGYVTIPIVSVSPIAATGTPITPTTAIKPSTTSALVQVTNAAAQNVVGMGALAAGALAMLL